MTEKKPLQIYFSKGLREKIRVFAEKQDLTLSSAVKTIVADKLN